MTFTVNADESIEVTVSSDSADDSLFGDYAIEVTVSLNDFPLIAPKTETFTVSITCPDDLSLAPAALVDIQGDMSEYLLEYDVTSLAPLQADLTEFVLVSVCHSTTRNYFVQVDTNTEVDFITADLSVWKLTIETEDPTFVLVGNTFEYKWLIDISDGQLGVEIAAFEVTYIGQNSLPYFVTPLPGLLQIYRQPTPFTWTYSFPEVADDDVNDEVTYDVSLTQTEAFMSYNKG